MQIDEGESGCSAGVESRVGGHEACGAGFDRSSQVEAVLDGMSDLESNVTSGNNQVIIEHEPQGTAHKVRDLPPETLTQAQREQALACAGRITESNAAGNASRRPLRLSAAGRINQRRYRMAGFTDHVFALMHLLGFRLLAASDPRRCSFSVRALLRYIVNSYGVRLRAESNVLCPSMYYWDVQA